MSRFAVAVEASWYGRGQLGLPTRCLLRLLSWLYAGVTSLRRTLYDVGLLSQTHMPVPVIVVGNLIVGGAGKTPLTRTLAQQLRHAGWQPGIISRGYGRRVPGVRAVRKGDDPANVGDEPLLYAADGFPVYVGERRVEAAKALLDDNPTVDILIADDGLQHYALARDIELVVFDQRGLGNGHLLPAGPLREGLGRLRRPQVRALVCQGQSPLSPLTVQGETDAVPTYEMSLVPGDVYSINDRKKVMPLAGFAGQPVDAVAGIGHPDRFFQMLREYGLEVVAHPYPDHHLFTEMDRFHWGNPVLMTEKDAVKCLDLADGQNEWFVVPVTAKVTPLLPLDKWLKRDSCATDGEV